MTDIERDDQLTMLETPTEKAPAPKTRKKSAKAEKTEKGMTFEEALAGLEELVAQLEQGELSLEESMRLYEQGVKLTAFCNNQLKNAKLKIEELKKTQDEE